MTNQEPGAPEPLTSEEESLDEAIHQAMVLRGMMCDGWHALGEAACQNIAALVAMDDHLRVVLAAELAERAALSHPESDTRDGDPCAAAAVGLPHEHVTESDTRRCRCELTATGSGADPNCAIHGLHPESDTRGLDAALDAFFEDIDADWHNDNLRPGSFAMRFMAAADRLRAARLAVSPDLSIDREGGYEPIAEPMVRAMMDVLAARGPFFHALLDEHPDRFVPILADAALAALRGTTQPEPTE